MRRGIAQKTCAGWVCAGAVSPPSFWVEDIEAIQGKVWCGAPSVAASSSTKRLRSTTLSHRCCHRLLPSGPRSSVVRGPPPRTPVRCPAPPDGALICSVKSAVAAQCGHSRVTRSRLTKWSLLSLTVFSPGASINSAATSQAVPSSALRLKSCMNLGPAPSNSKAAVTGANHSTSASLLGGSLNSLRHSESRSTGALV